MLRNVLRALLVLGVLFAAAAPSNAQLHKDQRLGFQIKVPKKWAQVPLQSDEQWVVAKYTCDKPDIYTDDSTGYTYKHVSSLRVVAFVDQFIRAAEEVDDEDEEDEDGESGDEGEDETSEAVVVLARIYRDYDEFLKKNFDGGFFLQEDDVEQHGDLEVRKLEIRAEESSGSGNRLLLVWIYTTEIGSMALEFEVLEEDYRKKKSLFEKTFKSFKPIERTEALVLAAASSDFISMFTLNSLTPEERGQHKRDMQDRRWAKMQAEMIDGWEALEFGDYRVLTCHDKKHAKQVADNVKAIMLWLDDAFPFVGPEEYVRPPFIRICKDREEERAFLEGGGSNAFVGEITTHKDQGGSTGYEWGYVKTRAVDVWFRERDNDLFIALPPWLRVGLGQLVSGAKVKGTKIKFDRNFWERGFQDGEEAWGLERVMRMDSNELRSSGNRPVIQSGALARFLVDGAGSKGKNKDFLPDYMRNLSDIIEELEAEDKAKRKAKKDEGDSSEPETEEEEDAMLKARKERFAMRQRRILDEAYDRTVAGLSDSQLSGLKKAYLKEVK